MKPFLYGRQAAAASYFMDPYMPPAPVVKGATRKKNIADVIRELNRDFNGLGRILKITSIVAGIMLAVAIGLVVFADKGPAANIGFLLLSPAILLLLIVAVALGYKMGNPLISRLAAIFSASDAEWVASIKEEVPALDNFSDASMRSLVRFVQTTKIGLLEQMIRARVNSMLSMVLDINLKQTRRLIYDIFFGNFYGADIWGNRRAFNVIYELSLLNVTSRASTISRKLEETAKKYPLPANAAAGDSWIRDCETLLLGDPGKPETSCRHLHSVAEQALTMGTTLWYDHADAASDRMKKVVSCGQFTTCAKLLEYTLVLERILASEATLPFEDRTLQFDAENLAIFKKVRAQLETDWIRFKEEPFFVYDLYDA